MGIFDFLKAEKLPVGPPLQVDMHSHLIHGVDDGANELADSLEMIKFLHGLGYKKFITTPHIMMDYYRNSYNTLKPKHDEILAAIDKEGINVSFDFAAEHYLDEGFSKSIKDNDVLTFGDNYVLFETNFMSRPRVLEQTIFDLQSKGYKPVFAHPERYVYLYDSFELYQELYEKGLFFQLNINSISGYYSSQAKRIAEKLIDNKMVHFAGSDCHHMKHANQLNKTQSLKHYNKMLHLNLLNDTLL